MIARKPVRMTTDEERAVLVQKHQYGVMFAGSAGLVFAAMTAGALYGVWSPNGLNDPVPLIVCGGLGLLTMAIMTWAGLRSAQAAKTIPNALPVHRIYGEFRIGKRGKRSIAGQAIQPLGSWPGGVHHGDVVEGEVVLETAGEMGVLLAAWHAESES
ncbi:MAG: hypothetical protein ACJATT_001489 [Myxococcota bacterium]